MAGRFSDRFGSAIRTVAAIDLPQARAGKSPEELDYYVSQAERERAAALKAQEEAQKIQESSAAIQELGSLASQYPYIEDPTLPEEEKEQNRYQDAMQMYKVFIKAFPDSKVSPEEFYQSGREKALSAQKTMAEAQKITKEAEQVGKTEDGKPRTAKSIAEEGIAALADGRYESWYQGLSDSEKSKALSPANATRENLQTVASSDFAKGGSIGGSIAKSKAEEAQAQKQIEDYGTYSVLTDSSGNKIRLEKRLNAENKEDVNDLRNSFKSEIKPLDKGLSEIALTKTNIEKTNLGSISGLQAINAIYRHMKGLDESGAVREGDIDLFMASIGLAERMENGAYRLVSGTRLDANTVQSIKDWLRNQEKNITSSKNRVINSTYDNAVFRGIHPKLVDASIPDRKIEEIKQEDKDQSVDPLSEIKGGDASKAKKVN